MAARLPVSGARELISYANSGFLSGLHASCAVAAACLLGALIVLAFLPAHPVTPGDGRDGSPPAGLGARRSARAAAGR